MSDDELMRRLRAADPARGRHPDLAKIRMRMHDTPLATTAAGDDGTRGSNGPNDPNDSDDTAVPLRPTRTHRPGERGRHTLIGVAAAATLALGVGGYLVGNAQAPDGVPTADPAITPQTTDAEADQQGDPRDAGDSAGSGVEMSDAPDGSTMVSDDPPSVAGPGRVGSATSVGGTALQPSASLATQAPGPETVERLDVEIDVEETLTAWAEALDAADGSVSTEADVATLTTEEFVYTAVGGSSSFVGLDSRAYLDGTQQAPTDGSASALTDDEAVAQFSDLIVAAGNDPQDFAIVPLGEVEGSTEVIALPQTDALWTEFGDVGFGQFVGDDLVSAVVPLPSTLTDLGEYPLLSPTDAVEAADDGRRQNIFLAAPYSAESTDLEQLASTGEVGGGGVNADDSELTADTEQGSVADLVPGEPLSAPAPTVTVAQTELIQAMYQAPDGELYVVPAYLATAEDGTTTVVIALADEALDFAR